MTSNKVLENYINDCFKSFKVEKNNFSIYFYERGFSVFNESNSFNSFFIYEIYFGTPHRMIVRNRFIEKVENFFPEYSRSVLMDKIMEQGEIYCKKNILWNIRRGISAFFNKIITGYGEKGN